MSPPPPPPALEIVIWDVQHGVAAFIKSPTGKTLAIDLGVGSYKNPDDATFSPLKHLRNNWGLKSLDALIITHPHTDHLDDIGNVVLVLPKVLVTRKTIPRDLVQSGNQSKDSGIIEQYFALVDSYNAPVTPDTALDNAPNWGCSINWFYPAYNGTNLNNYSIVTVISYPGSKIIIPGDNEAASWNLLLNNAAFTQAIKNADVLIAPHHGRESGYHADLFKHFKPSLVVVSDTNNIETSATNRYTYQATGWRVFNRETKEYETRKTVTTRSDDAIFIRCHRVWSEAGKKYTNYRSVTIN